MSSDPNSARRSQSVSEQTSHHLLKKRSFRFLAKWTVLTHLKALIQNAFQPQSQSSDYQEWQLQFFRRRLRLAFWIIFPCVLTFASANLYEVFSPAFSPYTPAYIEAGQKLSVWSYLSILTLLILCVALNSTPWGKRHPAFVFLLTCWSLTIPPQIVSSIVGITFYAVEDWILVFLGQAILIPVRWRLHLISQIVAVIYPLGFAMAVTSVPDVGHGFIENSYTFIRMFWTCCICCLAVSLYERLKRSELSSQRQLHILMHSVSHDLKTPVMGTVVVLQNLLEHSTPQISVDRSVLERLRYGSDRQLKLINTLLEARASEVYNISLSCESIALRPFLENIVSEFLPQLTANQISVNNCIHCNLPNVYADKMQLWRVYCNLIENAILHNPHGIHLTFDAQVIEIPQQRFDPSSKFMLRCTVEDNGIGLPPVQSHHQLFELYTRGNRSRYMPGLGLGLYSCKQIIAAHGGEIGVDSQPEQGSTFWFTLPLN